MIIDPENPELWQRRRRTRKVLVAGTLLAVLVAAPVAALYLDRNTSRGRLPSPAGPSGASSLDAGTPDPFVKMTPAGIDALDEAGLCKAMCRTNLECAAFKHPDWSREPLEKGLTFCTAGCTVASITPHDRDPKAERMARDCLKTLDCKLFEECVFGPLGPPAPGAPAGSAPTTASGGK